jgi:hypothetical protein
MTFRDWIAYITPQTLHRVCGYRDGTIRMWATRNVIPRGVWPDIMTAGLASLSELLAMEKASRP